MANIRRKIEDDPAQPKYIFTEVGVGYRMARMKKSEKSVFVGTFRADARRKPCPFDAPFAADGDMATVTWSNLLERLKRMGCGVNFKADA